MINIRKTQPMRLFRKNKPISPYKRRMRNRKIKDFLWGTLIAVMLFPMIFVAVAYFALASTI